ncbi:MAG: glucosyl-3-phosphoglycerate synthase [Acidimicrobiia bacterium]|nr:glucosyl-3-phosphoglycerate synthase [Acidimicrobiia bacterium]
MIRTFHHRDARASSLVERKGTRRISVCLPARNEAATIGPIVAAIHAELVRSTGLVDELVVIDDHSEDDTAAVAGAAGARVVRAADILPDLGLGPGKGQALWKSLHVTDGDIVTWCDADIRQFDVRFVVGVLAPLLEHDDLGFVKGFYDRPIDHHDSGGGRVTELVARPLVSMLFPHLSPIVQPLAGEYGGRRDVLEQVPFAGGYGVELGLLIDIAARFGTLAIGQVDLGRRIHRNRPLDELGPQAAAIMFTALQRADPGLAVEPAVLTRPGVEPAVIDHSQMPPVAQLDERRAHTTYGIA